MTDESSTEVARQQCPGCRSAGRDTAEDNLVVYSNGWKECFACGYKEGPPRTGNPPYYEDIRDNWSQGLPLEARGISDEAADFFGVRVKKYNGQDFAYAYPLTVDGKESAFQVRKLPKEMFRRGESKGAELFGWNTVGNTGQMIIVAEGQDDTLAGWDCLRILGKQYKIVGSLGTTHWKKNVGHLEGFDKVFIAFDQDEAGKLAAQELAEALSPGKARIMSWSGAKDINDLLNQNRPQDFLQAINKAKPVELGGLIEGEAAWNIIKDYTKPESVPYPPEWEQMNAKFEGLRRGEISVWTAGSSIGKSLFIRRLKQHIIQNTTWRVGDVELEEAKANTIRAMLQFEGGKPLWTMSEAEKYSAYEATYGTGRLVTLDHRASRKSTNLVSKFRHLRHSHELDVFFVDHVTLGIREYGEGNAAADDMMEEYLEFVEQTGAHLCLISHLRKPSGGDQSWSQGRVPTEEDMKGSGSLYQIPADVVALSRDKTNDNPYLRNTTFLWGLKCRETGNTGQADALYFDPDRRLLLPADYINTGNEDHE